MLREESDKIMQEFTRAYDEHSNAIFRHCLFKVSHRETALDITQETYRKTWEKVSQGESIVDYRAFLFRAANNLIIDYYRKKKEVILDEDTKDFGSRVPVQADEAPVRTDYALALETLNQLDEKYRQPVYLRHVEGFSVKEIARILDEKENNVSVSINRGLNKLRKILNKDL